MNTPTNQTSHTPADDEQVYEMNCDTCGATHIYDNETTATAELEEHRGIGHAANLEQVA